MLKHTFALILLLALVGTSGTALAQEVNIRVKDAAKFRLSGGDTLEGQGLVVGLAGTGDADDEIAQEMLRSRFEAGSRIDTEDKFDDEDFSVENVARVVVTLKIESGQGVAGNQLDATVSISSQAESLRGGQLLLTYLYNAADKTDETVYATSDGAVYIPPMPEGQGGNGDAPNGTVPAVLVEDIEEIFADTETDEFGNETISMTLQLTTPNTSNANAIARAINNDPNVLGLANISNEEELASAPRVAKAEGSGKVVITVPEKWHDELMEFREIVEDASFPAEVPARVIIHMESGVVSISNTVRFSPGTIIAAGVTIQVGANQQLPPANLPEGEEMRAPAVPLTAASRGVNDELLQTLNVLNLSGQEKIEVLRALYDAGMLHGDLIVKR